MEQWRRDRIASEFETESEKIGDLIREDVWDDGKPAGSIGFSIEL